MNKYELLLQEAADNDVNVYDYRLTGDLNGLYIDGNIAIDTSIKTTAERSCILAEELGHHHTTVGNILDPLVPENIKQERKARIWAYNNNIGLRGLIRAFERGCNNKYDIADYLEVTDQFLQDALQYYESKYGEYIRLDNYIIYFIPNLSIGKMI